MLHLHITPHRRAILWILSRACVASTPDDVPELRYYTGLTVTVRAGPPHLASSAMDQWQLRHQRHSQFCYGADSRHNPDLVNCPTKVSITRSSTLIADPIIRIRRLQDTAMVSQSSSAPPHRYENNRNSLEQTVTFLSPNACSIRSCFSSQVRIERAQLAFPFFFQSG